MSGLILLFISGLISLNFGKHFLEKNTETIQKTAHYQQITIDRYAEYVNTEMGLLLYYLRFGLANSPDRLSGLSIGQRDITPSVHSVTIRNLEEQKYSSELTNPMYQLLGNLDFSFILIYFFPLIIIAFCFNLISEEKEEGTWRLVLSQAGSPQKMLRTKLAIRYLSVVLVLAVLLFVAKFYLTIPITSAFLAYGLSCLLYVSFWFCLCWLIISFHRNSSQSALLLLVCWIMLTMIIPASLQAWVVSQYPVPEAYATVLESRDGYHTQWDKPKEPTVDSFHKRYPQFEAYSHPAGKDYSWLWYYAMQHMGDEAAAKDSKALRDKLRQRNEFSRQAGLLFPSIHTQLTLNELCLSDLDNYLNFLEKLEEFHEQKRLYFYPKIFEESPVPSENWNAFPLEYFQDTILINWVNLMLPYLLISLLCLVWAQFNFTRHIF